MFAYPSIDWFWVLLFLCIAKLTSSLGLIGEIFTALAMLLHVYLPFKFIEKTHQTEHVIGFSVENIKAHFILSLKTSLLVFPVYIFMYAHFYSFVSFSNIHLFEPIKWVLVHTMGVALPEELFYRGYLQPFFELKQKHTWKIWGVAIGSGTILCNGLFALGHFLMDWNPYRLLPFFPGLLFAWLRNKSNSIWPSVFFHALCNILGEFLFVLYQ